ncbi:hypothetical protein D3C86_1759400 [compost metagenome]
MDVGGRQPGTFKSFADNPRLRFRVGGRVTVGLTTGINGRPANHTVDTVICKDRIGIGFDQDRADAFAVNETVRRRAKRAAGARTRQHVQAAELLVMTRVDDQVDSTDQRLGAVAAAYRLTRQVQRGQ